MSEPILKITGLNKSFGAIQVLHDVDFAVYPGEVTALVGDNGAGKSTLVKCIAGINSIDTGEVLWEGRPVKIHSPNAAAALGIQFVYQDLALSDNLDITANMFLGRELTWGPFMRDGDMERMAREKLTELSVRTVSSVKQVVNSLSGGQRQSVAIAKSVLFENSKVVFLDEPTAALGVAQTEQVLALVKRLREQGLGVVVITHNIQEVFEVADRIIVLRLGRRVATFNHADATPEDIVGAITGARGQEAA
jgi:D-xylose transport system ATP-binding protein